MKYQVLGMDHEEVHRYVNEKFKSVGVLDEIIEKEALKTILTNSGNSTRKLDQIITQALIIGAKQNKDKIDNEIIYQANAEVALI